MFWFLGFLGFISFPPSVLWFSMVSSSEVRIAYPSISFIFARLGGSLGVFPYLENFFFEGSSLSVALANLLPLLRQSIDQFDSLGRERGIMSEVRLSEIETGLSSNDSPVEARGDTVVSAFREVRAFYAFDEVCGLDGDTLSRFKNRFQFPDRVRVRLPREEDWACHFFPREVC